jgi:NADPH:quinone reductase-like Zn-dependent oxidoreductase
VLDSVGASYQSGNVDALKLQGRMISVGLTSGSRGELDMSILMRKRLTIFGTVLRARPIEEKIALARKFSTLMVPMFESGRLKAVIDSVFDFADVRQAHLLMESNRSFGKIVLRWS